MDKPTRFVGDDDQKNIDDLVAAGIRADQALIAMLQTEALELGVYWSKEVDQLKAEIEVLRKDAELRQWQPMDTCPRHKDVLFCREDAGVFTGQFTYCEAFMTEKEVEESNYDEQTLYAEDAFSFGPDGAYRCDGDLVPTHWMPFPGEPVAAMGKGEQS